MILECIRLGKFVEKMVTIIICLRRYPSRKIIGSRVNVAFNFLVTGKNYVPCATVYRGSFSSHTEP